MMRAALLLWIACVVAVSASATARAAPGPESLLERGIQFYEEGELARAEPLLRGAAADLKDARARARAFLYLGLVQASRKDLSATRDSLRAALSEDPLVVLARERVAPDLVAMFDGVRAELSGELWLDEAGAGARYFLDGRDAGPVAAPLRLPIGAHTLRVLSADGRGAFEAASVVVGVRQPARLRVLYRERTGRLRLADTWKGARLLSSLGREARVEGEVVLPMGPQRLTLTLPGHLPAQREVVVLEGGVVDLSLPAPVALLTTPWYRKRRVWGYVALGVAGAAGLTGLLLGKLAQNAADELAQGRANNTLRYDQFTRLRQTADSDALIANVLFGLTGAAAIAGVLLVVTDRGEAAPARSWRILPTLGGASFALKF